MKSIISFAVHPRPGAAFALPKAAFALPVVAFALIGLSLAGCSTVKGISPFTSNVPYAQDVTPNIARPATPEIPVYKAAPPQAKPPTPSVQPASPPPAQTAAPAPTAAPQPAAPAPSPQSSIAPPPAPAQMASNTPAPEQVAAAKPLPEKPVAEKVAPEKAATEKAATEKPVAEAEDLPMVPQNRTVFNDDGTYPNLAQVPARPVNMPTFLEASAIEKSLIAERDKAKAPVPDSPAVPSVQSTASPVVTPTAPAETPKAAPVVARTEDNAPCLTQKPVDSDPTAIVRFDRGSSALTSDDMQILAESLPTVRQSKGTIRILGHGDSEPGAPQAAARFDLATARAGAVAQALAGFGIPAPRIALGVACTDAAIASASAQLYTES